MQSDQLAAQLETVSAIVSKAKPETQFEELIVAYSDAQS